MPLGAKEVYHGDERTIVRPRLTSSKFHKSTATAVPTVRNAKRPTILHEIVKERKTPVMVIQVHHGRVNSLLWAGASDHAD